MPRIGVFDPELRRETLFDAELVREALYDYELIGLAGEAGPTEAPNAGRFEGGLFVTDWFDGSLF